MESPLGKPWKSVGTAMPPNTLLMCKLLLLLLLVHGFVPIISDPYIPFISALDVFRQVPGLFRSLLLVVFCAAATCLVFNYRVRSAAMALGATVLLVVLASKPGYRNHILIVGCLFFLAGLHRRDEEAWLIKLQFSLMYFGAFLNKLLDPDWRTGQFIHGWLHGHLKNPFYETLSPFLPDLGFATLLSWSVIVSEFLLMILFLVPRWHNLGVYLALAMHLSFLMTVGRRPFGHFTEDIMIGLLVFLSWPRASMPLRLCQQLQFLVPYLNFLNWDKQLQYCGATQNRDAWLEIELNEENYVNIAGLTRVLKYNAAFYVGLFFAFNGIAYLISRFPF